MGLSIQEQLLNAGLVDKKQAKKADHEKRVKNQKKRKGRASDDGEKQKLQQQQAQRAEQDRQLNLERNQQAQRKADLAAAQQLIATNRIPVEEGDAVYNYVAAGKINRISLKQEIADKLAEGRIGLAMHNGEPVLISIETVSKVLQRNEDSILVYNDPAQIECEYPTDW
jgi:uncharacterized protein